MLRVDASQAAAELVSYRWQRTTKAERSEHARKMAQARWSKVMLQLTNNPKILNAARNVGALQNDADGVYVAVQHLGQVFKFYAGKALEVPESAVEHVINSSLVDSVHFLVERAPVEQEEAEQELK